MQAQKILFIVIIIILLRYSITSQSKYQKKKCIEIVTVILTLFSGLRSWYIGDCIHYCNVFVACNVPGWEINASNTDTTGLIILFKIAGKLGIGFEGCLFIIAAFVAISLGILVYKYSPSVYWSYIIYLAMGFYIFTFSGLKQAIAMSFCIWAMMAVFEKKIVKFIIFVTLASIFHIPAIAFIIIYPFAHKKIDLWYFITIFIMCMCVLVGRDQIVSVASEIYYEDNTMFQASEGIGGKFLMMLFIMGISLVLRPLRKKDIHYKEVFNVMVIAAIVQSFSVYDNVFTRLADYYYVFIVLFIPMMMQSGDEQVKENPKRRYEIRYFTRKTYDILAIGITLFAIVFYWRYVEQESALLNGFKFFWQADDVLSSMELLKRSIEQWGI